MREEQLQENLREAMSENKDHLVTLENLIQQKEESDCIIQKITQ